MWTDQDVGADLQRVTGHTPKHSIFHDDAIRADYHWSAFSSYNGAEAYGSARPSSHIAQMTAVGDT